mgnify:CR=1 FL=1
MPKKYCPPNTFCIDDENIIQLLGIILIVMIIMYFLYNNYYNKKEIVKPQEKKQEIIINNNIDNDDKNLLEPPGRRYFGKGVPINIRTRGEPNDYSQIGILTSETNPEKVLPLFGRQTYRGSNLWNYYSALDSNLATKIPIQKNRDCIGTHGCSEINNDDTINLTNSQENYKVQLYPYNDLQYIPYF